MTTNNSHKSKSLRERTRRERSEISLIRVDCDNDFVNFIYYLILFNCYSTIINISIYLWPNETSMRSWPDAKRLSAQISAEGHDS